jgi:hypothetical protein
MKNEKYHIVGTVPKSDRKIVDFLMYTITRDDTLVFAISATFAEYYNIIAYT